MRVTDVHATAEATPGHTGDQPWRLGYRPELDGVRGIAIILVFISHFALGGRAGGLAGVTVFFVLSGFLITSLLLVEHRDSGRISLRSFYARRVRRLLPALAAVVVATTLWQVVMKDSGAGWHGLAALSYLSNWIIIAGGDLGVLAHTWSLAVEEQFYLVWPLLLTCIIRFQPRWLGTGLLVVAAASLLWRVTLVADGASVYRIAYGFDARADALLIGAALAVAIVNGWRSPHIPAWLGVPALVVVGMLTWYTAFGLTLGLAATALVSALTIIAGLHGSSALAFAPLVRIGRISYGLYLYHFPLMALFGPVVALFATFVVAAASYRWLESPFIRRSSGRPLRWPPGSANTPVVVRGVKAI